LFDLSSLPSCTDREQLLKDRNLKLGGGSNSLRRMAIVGCRY
jgi:hypothetical protein